MRAGLFVVVGVALACAPGSASAQRTSEVTKLDGLEHLHRLFGASDRTWHLIATPTGAKDPVLISSTQPRLRVPLPGADGTTVLLSDGKRGVLVTWESGDQVLQVSSATRALIKRKLPPKQAAETRDLGVDASGTIVIATKTLTAGAWNLTNVLVFDPKGRTIALDPALFANAESVSLRRGGLLLVVPKEGAPTVVDLAKKQLVTIKNPRVTTQVAVAEPFEQGRHAVGTSLLLDRPHKAGQLQLKHANTVVWSIEHAREPFALVGDAIVRTITAEGRVTVQRIDFDGGLAAWGAKRVADLENETRLAKLRDEEAKRRAEEDKRRAEEQRIAAEQRAADERRREQERAAAASRASSSSSSSSSSSASSSSSSSSSSSANIEDTMRQVKGWMSQVGYQLERSRVGVSTSSNPLQLDLRIGGGKRYFLIVAIVDKRAVVTRINIDASNDNIQSVDSSYNQTKIEGWLLNMKSFTIAAAANVTLKGGGVSDNAYPTALMLFSGDKLPNL